MNRVFWYLLVFATLFLGGCASSAPSIDYDPAFDTSRLTTFGVAKERSPLCELDDERIEAAIVEALEAKGYRFKKKSPHDFQALYRVETFHDIPSNFSFGLGIGGGSWKHGGVEVGTSLTPHHDEIALRIDMVRPGDHRIFWSGRIRTTLPPLRTPKERESFYRKTVVEILKRYPAHHR